MSAHEILFTNAAIQNQEFSLDEKPQKAVGILAARVLNTLYGDGATEVHTWNNVGAFHDAMATTPAERLAQKYDSIFAQRYLAPQLTDGGILTDDGDEFSLWSRRVFEKMLQEGTVYEEKAEFTICTQCGVTIAESTVGVGVCPRCNDDSHLYLREERALFATTPPAEELLPYGKLFNQVNVQHEMGTLRQIPYRLLLSRTRQTGIPLDEFGLEGRKLDPRLGIGLLALFAAQRHDYERAGVVQSISTLNRIAPYLSSTVPSPEKLEVPGYVYAFHGKIQPELLHDSELHPQTLALYSLGQRSDITERTAQKITRETKELSRRLEIVTRIYTDRSGSVEVMPSDIDETSSVDLTNIVAKTNKALGRSLETMKHDKDIEQVEADAANKAIVAASVIRDVLGDTNLS